MEKTRIETGLWGLESSGINLGRRMGHLIEKLAD